MRLIFLIDVLFSVRIYNILGLEAADTKTHGYAHEMPQQRI